VGALFIRSGCPRIDALYVDIDFDFFSENLAAFSAKF
jgi:hypothetical protein